MFSKLFIGAVGLAGAASATYGTVTNGIDDACLAIRKTIQTTVTVTVNPDGSLPYTLASGPKVDGKPSGPYVHAAASGTGYGKVDAEADKFSLTTSAKKGGYGHGNWDDEPAATSSGSWKHGYGGDGSWDEDDEAVASKSWGSGGYSKDPKYSHAYAKASSTPCDTTKDSYKPSSPAKGYYGRSSSSSVGGKAGYDKVTSSSAAGEGYGHLPSDLPHSDAPEPSFIRSSSRTWSFSNSTWTRSSPSQSVATSSKLSLLSISASSSKASSSSISSSSTSSSKLSSSSVISSSVSLLSSSSSSSIASITSSSSSSSFSSSSSLSSSSSDSISSSVTSFTSSSSSSTVSSASSTSSAICVPVPPGNAVLNGGFQLGVLAPWTATTTGTVQLLGNGGVAQDQNSQDGDGFDFLYVVRSASGGVTLSQTVTILDGTTVSCSAYLQTSGNNPFVGNLAISIDGEPCGSITQASAIGAPDNGWQPATGSVTVSGNTHVVSVATSGNNVDDAGALVYIDNVQIIPTAGPGSIPICVPTN